MMNMKGIKGTFESIRKIKVIFYVIESMTLVGDADLSCTFDYIKHIKWHFDIEE